MRSKTVRVLLAAGLLGAVTGFGIWLVRLSPYGRAVVNSGTIPQWVVTVLTITLCVFLLRSWRVRIRGARGSASVSMAVDIAAMLVISPTQAAIAAGVGMAVGDIWYKKRTPAAALVEALVNAIAVGVGGVAFYVLHGQSHGLLFPRDYIPVIAAVSARLAVKVALSPMAGPLLFGDSFATAWAGSLTKLPHIPYLMDLTLGVLAAALYQAQPWAAILLAGPLAAIYAATAEHNKLNETNQRLVELNKTLEDKVAQRTAELQSTVSLLRRRLLEAESMQAVSLASVQKSSLEGMLAIIARESAKATGGTSALVTLLSDSERQYIRAVWGEGLEPFLGTELPVTGTYSGEVIRTRKAQISENAMFDPQIVQPLAQAGQWRSVIEAPLLAKDRVLGVLVVAAEHHGAFDHSHLRLLTLLANQGGLIIENTRLQEKERAVAVLEERNRLARELHDSVTQSLFSVVLNLESATQMLEKKPEKVPTLLTRTQEIAQEALAEMRSLIFELRPSALQEKGLPFALSNHLTLFRRRQSISTHLELLGETRAPADVEFCLYRVAQEALTNVAKHARAKSVRVVYDVNEHQALLKVEDDGVGFETANDRAPTSFGLTSMAERVIELGGELQIESQAGQGTTVLARIPLHERSLTPTWQASVS